MRIKDKKILLEELHSERLLNGMQLLEYNLTPEITWENLKTEIERLIVWNGHEKNARVRLTVIRGNGGLYNEITEINQFLIESSRIENYRFNEKGLHIGLSLSAVKAIDKLSNIKSANYLPYVMAEQTALKNKWDDALVLNSNGNICDASIANIFWIKDQYVFTPYLNEAPVAGTMRKYLLNKFQEERIKSSEQILTEKMLLEADEVFLTNVIHGIRWVEYFKQKKYSSTSTKNLFTKFLLPLNH